MFEKIEFNSKNDDSSNKIDSHEINTLKCEHLKGDFKPITTSIGTRAEHFSDREGSNDLVRKAIDVDFYGYEKELRDNGVIKGGKDTYVMSSVDIFNKKSSKFIDCTGVVAVGAHKNTGNNISFLTHQFPGSFLLEDKKSFDIDLRTRLQRLKERSVNGSIDVIIVGGNYINQSANSKLFYKESIKVLSKIIEKELGFSPTITAGPKDVDDEDAVEFDTENRRLYFIRGKKTSKSMNEPYIPNELEEKIIEWNQDKS